MEKILVLLSSNSFIRILLIAVTLDTLLGSSGQSRSISLIVVLELMEQSARQPCFSQFVF